MMRKLLTVIYLAAVLLLGGCGAPAQAEAPVVSPSHAAVPTASPTADPEEAAREAARQEAIRAAGRLADQGLFDDALTLLADPSLEGGSTDAAAAEIRSRQEALVPYEGELRHIFFHSRIVYPEMVFTDLETPMGGYNSGFAEKAELERILPQLYERGYVLYDLAECFGRGEDGKMCRKEILLPPADSVGGRRGLRLRPRLGKAAVRGRERRAVLRGAQSLRRHRHRL